MKIFIIIGLTHLAMTKSSQISPQTGQDDENSNLQKLQEPLQIKLQTNRLSSKLDNQTKKTKALDELNDLRRKSKGLALYPFFPPSLVPFGLPPGPFFPPNKNTVENSYSNELLSRTEPFKKNPPLLDSPTYYIRLPPNPYVFIPGIGYVSRPPSLSDPEVLEANKPEQTNQIGNDILQDPFYRLPINFMSNGKPTGVYQLQNGQNFPKPESPAFVNLNKGPYVFNGKPNEIFLIAQIYDALYGDELAHFYP